MPFTNGVFANVVGATSAVAGAVIQSAIWNAIHADYSTALNMLMGQAISTPTNRNIVWMNGGLEIWQRGDGSSASITVAASSTVYTADRWYVITNANQASTVSAQAGLVDESQLCARVQRDSGQTGLTAMHFAYPLDTDEIYRCRGNIVNLSFRARAGANWSPASGTLGYRLYAGTGAVGKRGATPYTGETTVITGSVNLTTSSQLVQASSAAILPITTTQLELQLTWTPVGTAGAADYFEIDDVQLEVSLSSSTFTLTSYDRLDFPGMLEGCKRHYQKTFEYETAPAAGTGSLATTLTVISQAAALQGAFWLFSPDLRVDPAPNFATYSALTATSSGYISTSNSASYGAIVEPSGVRGLFVHTSVPVASAGNVYVIHAVASAGI